MTSPGASDRRLKTIAFAVCLAPLAWLVWLAFSGGLGANPIEAVIRSLGDWALRLLVIVLVASPLGRLTGWSWPGRLRRMLGLFAFVYAALHVLAYAALDQAFAWASILADLAKRRFILVGAFAFAILSALAATSSSGMRRRLGPARWRALHRLIYLAAPLAVLHYVMMVKADLRPPLIYGVLVALLLAERAAGSLARRPAGGPGVRCAATPPSMSEPAGAWLRQAAPEQSPSREPRPPPPDGRRGGP